MDKPDPQIDPDLISVLETLREQVQQPVHINSGFRCPERNFEVRGVTNSYHLRGMAADIWVPGIKPIWASIWLMARYPDQLGLGFYREFTHVDSRSYKARFGPLFSPFW